MTDGPDPDPPQRATLKEVAERAGVSINTASVVLNPRRQKVVVHPDTRARVEAAARELGYRRNLAASRLAGGAANTFCIVTDRMSDYYHSVILDAFEGATTRQGFQSLLVCTASYDEAKLEYLQGLHMQGYDGYVLVPVWEAPAIRACMPALLQPGMPVVFIDYRYPGHPGPVVSCDHRHGSRLLAEHLVEQGHRRILYLRVEAQAHVSSVDERIAGARDVFEPAGAELQVVTAANMEPELAAGAVLPYIQGAASATAIMCANDHLAFSCIAGLNRAGIHVLGHIAVTGFDDVSDYLPDLLEFPRDSPFLWELPLTSVRQPMEEIGRRAAEVLVDLVRGKDYPKDSEILLPGILNARQSTAHRVS